MSSLSAGRSRFRAYRVGMALLGLFSASLCFSDQFEIDWYTIDGGGAMNCTGGTFTLDGTIGQSDAGPASGPMTGGGFSLEGGFWPGAVIACPLPGDMDGDLVRNGRDIQQFVNCLVGVGPCFCADTNASGSANTADIVSFVNLLTN